MAQDQELKIADTFSVALFGMMSSQIQLFPDPKSEKNTRQTANPHISYTRGSRVGNTI